MYVCFRCRSVRQCLVRRCKAGTYLFVLLDFFTSCISINSAKLQRDGIFLDQNIAIQIENKTTHTVKQELYQTEKQKKTKQKTKIKKDVENLGETPTTSKYSKRGIFNIQM